MSRGRGRGHLNKAPGSTMQAKRTIACPAQPDLYVVLDALRRAKQRDTGTRVTMNAMVLELILTHPRVAPKLPAPLPEAQEAPPTFPFDLDVDTLRRQLALLTTPLHTSIRG